MTLTCVIQMQYKYNTYYTSPCKCWNTFTSNCTSIFCDRLYLQIFFFKQTKRSRSRDNIVFKNSSLFVETRVQHIRGDSTKKPARVNFAIRGERNNPRAKPKKIRIVRRVYCIVCIPAGKRFLGKTISRKYPGSRTRRKFGKSVFNRGR